jgi:hypothetical protein
MTSPVAASHPASIGSCRQLALAGKICIELTARIPTVAYIASKKKVSKSSRTISIVAGRWRNGARCCGELQEQGKYFVCVMEATGKIAGLVYELNE